MLKRNLFNTVLMREYSLLLLLLTCFSCANVKKVTYFNGIQDGTISSDTPIPETVIQRNDLLDITITSLNAEASKTFNMTAAPGADPKSSGYLVNSDGFIQIALLEPIKAEGLTKKQLQETITKKLLDKKLLVDPIVNIRFLNFRVTVLGEVNTPQVVTVPNEKLSLLEAIGLAGDITLFGKKSNVMIIREDSDKKIIKRVDLNSDELFTSPYYYLKSNDIVYVEPSRAKVATTNPSNQWIPVLFSALSLAVVVYQVATR